MKSSPHRQIPNMRGKKMVFFKCRCCDAVDMRGDYSEKLARRYVKDMLRGKVWREHLHPAEAEAC